MVVLNLLQNIALLVALSVVHQVIIRRWRRVTWSSRILSGFLFGVAGIVGMMTPLHLGPGLIFDGRSIILSVAGLFGGPFVAALAAIMCGAYRLSLGGIGAWVGTAVIFQAAALGAVFHVLRKRGFRMNRPAALWGFGLLVHSVMLALMLALPGGAGIEVLRRVGLPILLLYPAATFLVCRIFLDQEERQRSENILRESEEHFRLLFERAPLAYQSLDSEGHVVEVNQAWLDLLGYDRDRAAGSWFGDFLARQDVDLFREQFQRFKESGEAYGVELQLVRDDGGRIIASIDGRIAKDSRGRFQRAHCILTDIGKRKQAEEALRRLNEELEQRVVERTAQLEAANKELEAFTYSVSHDLRAPLRALEGFSQILVEDHLPKLDTECQRLLGVVRSNTQQMGRLIDDLLAFSRVSRYELKAAPLEMTGLARSVLADLLLPEACAAPQVRIDPLPDARADASLIRQVWVNLLSNALKFSRGKDPRVIEVGGHVANGETVYHVKDNGVGFDTRYGHKLFGVFQRLHKASEFEGTGVGLAIVQRIVNRHGGRVWAEGAVGQGATFYFSLPGRRDRA